MRQTAAPGTTGKLVTTNLFRPGSAAGSVQTWVPPANLVPTHDLDGNLTWDGRWNYTWDGENRLVSMTTATGAITGGAPNVTVKFAYDWMGRRIGKTTVQGGTTNHLSFAYDHWNLVAEWKRTSLTASLATAGVLQRTHLWGPDIASSADAGFGGPPDFQAAGGVAGLLASTFHSGSTDHFVPSYDANGNILAWSQASTTPVQRMDYDPFGNAVMVEKFATSTVVDKLPAFGFSTKYQDRETGLYYYGYRYYDPVQGRWPSRDPIEEEGGLNLCGMVRNNVVSSVDYLGLDCILVADRAVGGTVGSFFHYALEYWTGCCPVKRKEINIAEYKNKVKYPGKAPDGFVEKDKVELLNTPGHKAWHWVTVVVGATRLSAATTSFWQYRDVGISVINYGFPAGNPPDTSAANIYDDNDGDVAAKWREIIANANQYKFAEQQGFTTFKNFPFSAYPALGLGTNSNTFVRQMVRQAGLAMKELGGSHPGPDSPDPNEARFKHLANPDQPHNKPPGDPVTIYHGP